jgi:AcrR family transcriptional regulator
MRRTSTDHQHATPEQQSAAAGGRRAQARQERYDAVFAAAIALFVERGYDGTTMEAIADRAGVARASVFNYFPRKQAILAEWAARRRQLVRDLAEARQAGEPPEPSGLSAPSIEKALFAYMDAWAEVNERMREETAACGMAALRETDLLTSSGVSRELGAYIDAAASRGETRPGLDARLAGMSLAAGYFAVLATWIGAGPGRCDLHGELRKLTELHLEGMLPRAHGASR